MNKKQRNRIEKWGKKLNPSSGPCYHCGQHGLHFVPPSMGEEGFFICEAKNAQAPQEKACENKLGDATVGLR